MPELASASDLEAERILTGLARGRFGRIAPDRIARHVLQSQGDADWAVRKAAFDALARRYSFGQRDGLQVAERPERGMLGVYRTSSQSKGAAGRARPYETALYGLAPLTTSCSCPDFVRSSLGLCKHGLVVLELLEQRGLGTDVAGSSHAGLPARDKPALRWSYAQPPAGPFDRLLRVHSDSAELRAARPEELTDLAQRARYLDTLERALASGAIQAEPAVATLLAEERTRTEQRSAIEPHRAAALASLSELKRTLYPYQLEGVHKFLERGRLLLADDMGLGKTTQAIAACHTLFSAGALSRALLIVPTPLKSQWQREWQNTSSVPLYLVEGSPKERKQLYRDTQSGVLVLGYEQLLRDLPQVQAFAPELVVLDEAQRIKNWATKSAAYVKSLAPTYRLVLTGTPLENRFDELASIMDFVDDLTLEPKWRLLPFHAVVQQGDKDSSGARNLDVLRARLATSMLRRTRNEVLKQLPSRTDTRIPVEMSEVQRARHDELRQPIAELSARAEQRSLTRGELMRLMQLLTTQRMICNGMAQVQFETEWPRCEHAEPTPALLESLFAPKLSVLRGLIEQVVIAQGRKVVVFSQWRKFLRFAEWAVRDVLGAAGRHAVFFTGAESGKAREHALAEFNANPLASVLFASDAGAVGLNLQHAASCCINLELPWNPALLEQRIGRVHRLGQSQPCDIYNLVTEEGIEGRIAKLLEHKQALFSAVFDSTGDTVSFGGPARQGLLANVKELADPWHAPLSAAADSSTDLDLPAAVTQDTAESARTSTLAKPAQAKPAPQLSPLEQHGIQLTQRADGGVRIEAPPELAARIAALLNKFASELSS
ncbi:MAG: hypothetical protein RL701_4653 [Pseudomonadota bacterium]